MNGSKYFLVVGGFLGFVLTFLVTFLSGNDIPTVLQRSSMGAIAGFLLMQFMLKVLVKNIYIARQRAQAEESKKEEEKAAQKEIKEEKLPTKPVG